VGVRLLVDVWEGWKEAEVVCRAGPTCVESVGVGDGGGGGGGVSIEGCVDVGVYKM